MTFRSMDPGWRKEMATFVTRVVSEIRPELAGNGGPIVLLQIENEFGNVMEYFGAAGLEYAQWSADLMEGLHTGVTMTYSHHFVQI